MGIQDRDWYREAQLERQKRDELEELFLEKKRALEKLLREKDELEELFLEKKKALGKLLRENEDRLKKSNNSLREYEDELEKHEKLLKVHKGNLEKLIKSGRRRKLRIIMFIFLMFLILLLATQYTLDMVYNPLHC